MAETTYDRTKPQKRFTAAVSRGLRESAVLAIGVIALVMLVALASYHRDDPGVLVHRQRRSCGRQQPHRALRRVAVATSCSSCSASPAYLFPHHAGRGVLRDVPAARRTRRAARASTPRCASAASRSCCSRAAASPRCTGARACCAKPRAASSGIHRQRARRHSISSAPRCSCWRPGWPACRWRSACPG